MIESMTWKKYKEGFIEKYGLYSEDVPDDIFDDIDWALVFDDHKNVNSGAEDIPTLKPLLVMANPVPGLQYVVLADLDYVVENSTSSTRIHSLCIGRYGGLPNIQLYKDQISDLKPAFFFNVCWRDVENVFYSKFIWRI